MLGSFAIGVIRLDDFCPFPERKSELWLWSYSDDRFGGSSNCSGPNRFFNTIPWFIIGFFLLLALRPLSLMPDGAIVLLQRAMSILTTMSVWLRLARSRSGRDRKRRTNGYRGGDAVAGISAGAQRRLRVLWRRPISDGQAGLMFSEMFFARIALAEERNSKP
jgi:hypothetical protein